MIAAVALVGLLIAPVSAAVPDFADTPTYTPRTLFATWDEDPTTTMTLQWLGDDSLARPLTVYYAADGSDDWQTAEAQRPSMPAAGTTMLRLYRVRIKNLAPDTLYRVRVSLASAEYTFRTAPAKLERPITFVHGGDAGPSPITRRMIEHAAEHDPLFGFVGGDIAYANGTNLEAWYRFLRHWHDHMRGKDGRLVPMIVCIGNHEVRGHYGQAKDAAPLFYAMFGKFDERGYGTYDFGDYLSIVAVDSAHTTPIEGKQTEWLDKALGERDGVAHVFVAWHVPAYPSHRSPDGGISRALRQHMVPIVEKHGVDAVFEHHDHTYKRTHPLRNGEPADDGIVYLGDGAWGVSPREIAEPEDRPYLKVAKAANHVFITTITPERRTHRAIDVNGEVFDEYESKVAAPAR